MHKEDTEPFSFEQQGFSLRKKANNKSNIEPFTILYNARSSRTVKSRKSSASLCNQNPLMFKKPRKMTLPLMWDKTSYQIDQARDEAHSQNNQPQPYSYEQNEFFYQNYKQKTIDQEMDLQKAIQYGIVNQDDLDKQSWFQIRNQNPQLQFNQLNIQYFQSI